MRVAGHIVDICLDIFTQLLCKKGMAILCVHILLPTYHSARPCFVSCSLVTNILQFPASAVRNSTAQPDNELAANPVNPL